MDRRYFMALGAGASALLGGRDARAAAPQAGLGRPVTELGIEPNASFDQSAAFQRAADYLASEGQPMLVPAGRYIAGRVRIASNTAVIGVFGLSVLAAPSGAAVFEFANAQNVEMRGLSFMSRAVRALDCRDVTIADCRVLKSEADGFFCSGAGLQVANNRVASCAGSGIHVEGDGIVTANLVSGRGRFGLRIGSAGRLGTLTVINNRIEGPAVGIAVSNAADGYAFIAMNMISGAANGGIRALNGDELIGKDLTRGGSEAFRNLAIAANVSL